MTHVFSPVKAVGLLIRDLLSWVAGAVVVCVAIMCNSTGVWVRGGTGVTAGSRVTGLVSGSGSGSVSKYSWVSGSEFPSSSSGFGSGDCSVIGETGDSSSSLYQDRKVRIVGTQKRGSLAM